MLKEDSYRLKFEKLTPWIDEIFQVIRKDLKNEHLLKTPSFVKKHFPNRAVDKIATHELASAYIKEITEGDEELGENIVTRWVMKNAEVYQFFASELSKINPKFDEIEFLSPEVSRVLVDTAVKQFGPVRTYLLCVMNGVVLSEDHFLLLREMALQEKPQIEETPSFASTEELRDHYDKQMRKTVEKYESRMQGLERKYKQDVDGLKKQIAQLHKKMSH